MKYSRQREGIFAYLQGRTDHPTAEMIYEEIRKEMPNISLGTVYRNLSLLAEMGKIKKINCEGSCDRFDPNTAPHYHFCCSRCGKIEDVPMTSMDSLNQLAQAYLKGKVESHSITFRGICGACLLPGDT